MSGRNVVSVSEARARSVVTRWRFLIKSVVGPQNSFWQLFYQLAFNHCACHRVEGLHII